MARHSFTALNSTFVVDAQYRMVKELGQGAYGCVIAAIHSSTGEGCAIKKITNINTKVSRGFKVRCSLTDSRLSCSVSSQSDACEKSSTILRVFLD